MKQRITSKAFLPLSIGLMALLGGCLPSPDFEPPVVTILNPVANETVSGTVPILVTASDDFEVSKIVILIEGVQQLDTGENPARFNWATAQGPVGADGQSHISAYAVDKEDHIGPAVAIAVTPTSPKTGVIADAPVVNLTSPQHGSSIAKAAGSVILSAEAFDTGSIKRVDFMVDGKLIGSSSNAPYEIQWNTAGSNSGIHHVFVTAWDDNGFSGSTIAAVVLQ